MSPIRPRTIVVALDRPLARAELSSVCARLELVLGAGGGADVRCELGALVAANAVTLDALARLQLTARRLGRRIRFGNASAELRELVALAGLAGVLALEPRRQPEEREQRLGVEEERELDDPPARELDHL
jgi:hypothetical protein